MESCTCSAPVNIAVIKYWGKRDENLVLPTNSSISVTLSQDQLRAKTTITASEEFIQDRIWLNGREESMDTPRIQNLLTEVKRRAAGQNRQTDGLLHWKVHVCSENNFPTAAGLASSAAGYACLAFTLAKLYNVQGYISDIARRGSGSACRSMCGGFVQWNMGEREDGADCVAIQVATETHWPELRVLILVVSDQQKGVGSSAGMQATVATSDLYPQRVRDMPHRVNRMHQAILAKDFATFAEITMKESNQLHAVCLDTYPPITYMTDVSRQIVKLVHAYNKHCGQTKVAYTFDAGPNACLYLLEEDLARVTSLVTHFFPPGDIEEEFLSGLSVDPVDVDQACVSSIPLRVERGAIKYVICTRPGGGPQVIDDMDESLLNEDGLPIELSSDWRRDMET